MGHTATGSSSLIAAGLLNTQPEVSTVACMSLSCKPLHAGDSIAAGTNGTKLAHKDGSPRAGDCANPAASVRQTADECPSGLQFEMEGVKVLGPLEPLADVRMTGGCQCGRCFSSKL